mmetsp:Transcript_16721/g.20092  ORF Transcript_16721/g.20092 Transcript_16721/m.20092 type:complete len:513 (+) Transcript_16721:1000-2538(+)
MQGPLTFELSVYDKDGNVLEQTHAGVDEFTAEEGSIGIPPKTALCLTKHRGLEWLKENPRVRVKYVVLKRHKQTFMRVQPRGSGFHSKDGTETVNLDIKTVLEKTLKDHFVISVGDWVPIVHKNEKYELIVRDLEPENAIELLNTDLEVDILPSEDTEAEINAKAEAKAHLQRFIDVMKNKQEEKKKLLDSATEPEKGKGVVTFRIRLPNSTVITRRFQVTDILRIVLDWIDYEISKIPLKTIKVIPSFEAHEYFFDLVESWPGHKRIVDGNSDADKPLKGLGFIKAGHSLNAVWKRDDLPAPSDENTRIENDSQESNTMRKHDEWNQAAQELQRKLQEEDIGSSESSTGAMEVDADIDTITKSEENPLNEEETLKVFNTLVEAGADPSQAAKVSRLYPTQVRDLQTMGFEYCLDRAVPYLLKYNGRLLRVTNAIFNEAEEAQESNNESAVSENDSQQNTAGAVKASTDDSKKDRYEELFQMKLAELLSLGVSPQEAAVQTLKYLKGQEKKP